MLVVGQLGHGRVRGGTMSDNKEIVESGRTDQSRPSGLPDCRGYAPPITSPVTSSTPPISLVHGPRRAMLLAYGRFPLPSMGKTRSSPSKSFFAFVGKRTQIYNFADMGRHSWTKTTGIPWPRQSGTGAPHPLLDFGCGRYGGGRSGHDSGISMMRGGR